MKYNFRSSECPNREKTGHGSRNNRSKSLEQEKKSTKYRRLEKLEDKIYIIKDRKYIAELLMFVERYKSYQRYPTSNNFDLFLFIKTSRDIKIFINNGSIQSRHVGFHTINITRTEKEKYNINKNSLQIMEALLHALCLAYWMRYKRNRSASPHVHRA